VAIWKPSTPRRWGLSRQAACTASCNVAVTNLQYIFVCRYLQETESSSARSGKTTSFRVRPPGPYRELLLVVSSGRTDGLFHFIESLLLFLLPLRKKGLLFLYGRLCVPVNRTTDIIDTHHDSVTAGHFGPQATYRLIRRRYYWPTMRQDVLRRVQDCEVCAREQPLRRHQGELQPLAIPDARAVDWTMDFITGFPNIDGYDAILVAVDRLTKFAVFIPTTKTVTAAGVADLVVKRLVAFFGLPRSIVTDRDTVFTATFWRHLLRIMGIEQLLSTAYHPETDGQTERVNQTLQIMLRCCSTSHTWVEDLPLIQLAYNNHTSATTGYSPYFLLTGGHPRLNLDVSVPTSIPDNLAEAATAFFQRQQEILRDARRSMALAQELYAEHANSRRHAKVFEIGDRVYLSTRNLSLEGPTRFKPRWLGPFPITAKHSAVAYTLQLPAEMRIHPTFHVSLLKAARHPPQDLVMPSVPVRSNLDTTEPVLSVLNVRTIDDVRQFLCYRERESWTDAVWVPESNYPTDSESRRRLRHYLNYRRVLDALPDSRT